MSSRVFNSSGVVKATVTATKLSGYVSKGKASFSPGRLLVTTSAPDKGTVVGGVGTNQGMLSVVLGPAPVGAIRRGGRAFSTSGQQYYVTSGTRAYCLDKLSYTSNGDLLVDTT